MRFSRFETSSASFDAYLWSVGRWEVDHQSPSESDPPVPRSELSDRLSKDLKRRGFTFVGSTIVYAYLQAVGVVNDHLVTCDVFEAATRSGR